jgi:tetratricopeptide (TPR) repeat protein
MELKLRRFWWLMFTFLTMSCSFPQTLWAQDDLQEQITAVTKEIKKNPRDTALFIRRGNLYRGRSDYDAAQADYDYAATLDPKLQILDFLRGQVFFEAKWFLSAKVALDRFLSHQPNHVEALITRARVLIQLGQRLAAVQDFTQALAHTAESRPDIYLERAQTLTAEGSAYFDQALSGIDEGIRKLGPLVTLQLYAIDLEVKQKQFDAALARLEQTSAQSPRKETWLERRGEILREAGRPQEAREAFKAALAALDTLPAPRRNVPAMQELEKRLRSAMEAIPPPNDGK